MIKELVLNTIYNEDCLETMRRMPDNFIDLIITDPPYGIKENAYRNNSRTKLAKTKDYGDFNWDVKLAKEYIDEILRVSKNQVIFGGNYYADWLPASSCWLVWDKDNTGNFADCELAWTSFKTAVRMFKYRWNGMIQEDMKNKEQRYHPTQKPLPLMRWVVANYSKETDIIYDPFIGSGSTLRACKDLEREYIGSEISKEYCDIADERLRQSILL